MNRLGLLLLLIVPLFTGCSSDERRYVIDCREASIKQASQFPGWQIGASHYDSKERRCFLSIEGTEAESDPKGVRLYTETLLLRDVDENRNFLSCTAAWRKGEDQSWLCNGPHFESISHDRFLELRERYLRE